MYLVIVSQSVTEIVHDISSKQGVQFLRSDHVSEHPPGDCDQPHDDEGHGDDVVEEVAAELAKTSSHVMAASPTPTDATGALID